MIVVGFKNFTLSKLENIKIKESAFKPNEEFTNRIKQNDTNWFSDVKFEVTLEIKSEAMSYFKRKKFLPNFKIISEDKDKIILSTEVAYDDEILRVVKYWLPFIKIKEPEYLRVKFEKLLGEYLECS